MSRGSRLRAGRSASGFTLLEMLLVVLIIGLTAGYVVLKMNRDLDQVARLEAERFASLLDYVKDESVLTGRPLAVEVDDFDGVYRFLRLEKEKWATVEGDTVLRERRFPEFLEVEFKLLQKAAGGGRKKKKARQLVILDPTGVVTPFRLSISGEQLSFVVTVDDDQRLVVGRNEKSS